MLSPFIQQDHMRLRNDDGGETGATWSHLLDEQHVGAVDAGTRFRIRIALSEQNGEIKRGTGYTQIQRVNSGAWITDTAVQPMQFFDSVNIPSGDNPTTQQITAGTFTPGYVVELDTVTPVIEIAGNGVTEYELCLEMSGVQHGNSYIEGDIIEVALAFDDLTLLDDYLIIPAFTAGVGAAGFSDLYLAGVQILDPNLGGVPVNEVYLGSIQKFSRG